MSTLTASQPRTTCEPESEWAVPPERLYHLSVEKYDELARSGVLTKNDRIELIEGLLVNKMTKNSRHLTATWMLDRILGRRLPDGWFPVTESPVALARSEPEPDVMLVRGEIADYMRRKPRPADVALLVEISDSSYAEDRARRRLFAEAEIGVYWIVNIPEQRVEVYTDPTGPGTDPPDYQVRRDYARGEEIAVSADGAELCRVGVDEVMPPL